MEDNRECLGGPWAEADFPEAVLEDSLEEDSPEGVCRKECRRGAVRVDSPEADRECLEEVIREGAKVAGPPVGEVLEAEVKECCPRMSRIECSSTGRHVPFSTF